MTMRNNTVENYRAGAITALALMAEAGANKEQVMSVAQEMDLSFIDIDESDREKLVAAYGEHSLIE